MPVVAAVALPTLTDTASRMASGPLPQKSGVSTGAKPGRPEQGANQNFLVLLLASLGPEQETPVAASDALAGSPDEAPPGKQATSEASSRPPVRDTHGLSGRETSKAPPVAARPAEVAYVAPAPAGLPATSFAGLTLDFAMDSRSGDGFDLSQSGESGTMFSTGTRGTLPPTELVSGAAAPNTARIDSASTSDVRSATHKSFPEDAPASAPAAGQTAFEARIQFSASGHPDELAPTVADGPPKVAATGEPAGGSGNQVMGLAIAASSSHAGSTQVSNHRDIGTAGAAKPLTDRGGNPSSGEASATDGTNPDSAGRSNRTPPARRRIQAIRRALRLMIHFERRTRKYLPLPLRPPAPASTPRSQPRKSPCPQRLRPGRTWRRTARPRRRPALQRRT